MKWLKRLGLAVVVLVALAILGLGFIYSRGSVAVSKKRSVQVTAVAIPTDSLSIAEGKRLATIKGCAFCHGADFGGASVPDMPEMIGAFQSAHIGPGKGSRTANYRPEDWVRSVRHGVTPEGRALFIMPSYDFHSALDDEDLGRIIAAIQHAPPVDRELPPSVVGPVAKLMVGAGQFPIDADRIDHTKTSFTADRSDSAAYGKYLAGMCSGCHGASFSGDDFFASPNIRGDGGLQGYSQSDFFAVLRSGRTLDGRNLNANLMPWTALGFMTDDELRMVWNHLHALPQEAPKK